MKSAIAIVPAFFLAFAGPRASGEDVRVVVANDAYQIGLWDVAARKYQEILADADITPDVRPGLALRLAECFIRDGNPADALVLLEPGQPASSQSDVAFWRGQALAGLGRFADAVAEFDAYLAILDGVHRLEAALTSANLQLSLENGSGALRTLASFADSADARSAARAQLQRATILLDSGYPEDARAILPEEQSLPPNALPAARYIRARLLLAESEAMAAKDIFAALLDTPAGQSLASHHGAALGFADATLITTGPEAASRSLLGFLAENPDTPLLDASFRRLQEWLPEVPLVSDSTLTKLAEWIPLPLSPPTGLVPASDTAAAVWPAGAAMPDIAAFAMFTRAVGIRRISTAAARHEARVLMSRLRTNFPNHFLSRRSLLVESRWLFDAGKNDAAFHRLSIAAENSRSRATRGEAMFLEAIAHAKAGAAVDAVPLFDEAASLLEAEFAEIARFNAALARLRDHPDSTASIEVVELTANLRSMLVFERALAMQDPVLSLAAIEVFLRDYPDHSRATEARLAVAERALLVTPPDVSLARAQIDSLGNTEAIPDAKTRIAIIRLRIADVRRGADDAAAAIEIARRILSEAPDSPAAVEAALSLGRNLFDTGNFNDARITFERLALDNAGKIDGSPALTQAAFLLAARAAALGATTQSRDEALTLFDRAIAVENAPLQGVATLEKARLMIDLNRLGPAIAFLTEARAAMDPVEPLYLPAGLLLGEAVYANAAGDSKSLEQALAIYDDLLDRTTESSGALYHRLQYLRGITLEKLPRPDAPALKREAEAIEAYYSVIQRAGDQPPAEWEWFERSAFAALSLLEKAERWQAAINLARRIASFNGPRAADAAERAGQLQLKHMIWED